LTERDESGIVRAGFVREDERGTFTEALNDGHWESVVVAQMRPQAVLGHHYHKLTDVFVYLTTGRAEVIEIDVASGATKRRPLFAGEGIWLHVNVAHAIRFEEESSIVLLKSRRYDRAEPDTYPYTVPL
jgi:quercetin dioxygenase-like cupin family protein